MGRKDRLVPLGAGDTDGAIGLCLDPHDLAISKYAARREKDVAFNREMARLDIIRRDQLLDLLDTTPVSAERKRAMRGYIEADFALPPGPRRPRRKPRPRR